MPSRNGAVHVATTRRTYKGKVYETHLLRRSYREGGKVKHQTLGNLSHLPADLIETIRRRLQGERIAQGGWRIVRTFPHGHVAAVLGTLRNVGLERVLASRRSRQRDVAVAMIVARILSPSSKLATARCLREETATSSLALELGLEEVEDKELYEALDWLVKRQRRIDEELRDVEGLDWITALRAEKIKQLVSQGRIEPSLFDQRELAEVSSPDYPGERLIVCRNPLLADERARKREELLAATEKDLDKIVAATGRAKRALRGKEKIALRVGKVVNRYKVAKHFVLEIEDTSFSYHRDERKIADESALDGIYVIRTSVETETFSPHGAVRAYKDLSKVERAFRSMKTIDLKVRPIYHWLTDRIRAHVFLCMLAYYVEWHLREKLAPILFDDHQKEEAQRTRRSIVAPAKRSAAARQKDSTKRTVDDYPVHSLQTLLADLATVAKNRVCLVGSEAGEFYQLTDPTPGQQHAFELLGVPITV